MGLWENGWEIKHQSVVPGSNIEDNNDFFLRNPEFENVWKDNFCNYDRKLFWSMINNILNKGQKDWLLTKQDVLWFWINIIKNTIKENKYIFEGENWNLLYKKLSVSKTRTDIETNIEKIRNAMNILWSIYVDMDSKYKWTEHDLTIFKQANLNKEKEYKLNKAGINIDDYLKYRFASVQLSKSNEPISKKHEFVKSFNQLNKFLEIDVQIPIDDRDEKKLDLVGPDRNSLGSLKTNADAVLSNLDIKSFVDDKADGIIDEGLIKLIREKFNVEDPKKIINLYASETQESIWRLKYVKDDLSIDSKLLKETVKDEKDIKKLEIEIKEKISKTFETSLNHIQDVTNKIFRERIMTNCFQALAWYFDKTTPGMENFADEFKMDINQDIVFDKNTKEIYMQWSINWNHVGLYYNLESGKLEMDDFMSYKNEDNWGTYAIWIKNGQREKLEVKLPTFQELKNWCWSIDIAKNIEKSSSISNYEENIKSDLNQNISKKFSNVALNKDCIEKFNEKNIAEQTVLSDIFYNWEIINWVPIIDFSKETKISKALSPKQYELIKLIYNSLENYKDANKLRLFRDCIARLNLMINTDKIKDGSSNEAMFNELFNSNNVRDSMYSRENNQWKQINYFQFFDIISQWNWDKRTINLEVLDRVLNIAEAKESINENSKIAWYTWFTDKYREQYNQTKEINLKAWE